MCLVSTELTVCGRLVLAFVGCLNAVQETPWPVCCQSQFCYTHLQDGSGW
jgi:hypothetical protein